MPQDAISRAIGARVREGRARLDLSRKRLAEVADVSERYLAELEKGEANVSIGVLGRIATALHVGLIDLISTGARAAPTAASAVHAHPGLAPPLADLVATMSPAEQAGAVAPLRHWLEQHRGGLKGVALLDLRGAGKTTLGRRLAERHAVPFLSITREIETRAGMSLPELFNLGGPEAYRTLENEVVAELVGRHDRIVLETAGGIAGNSEALDVIFGAYRTVWLRAAPEEHLARVSRQGDMRPMQGNPRALEHLKSLLAQREAEYARAETVLDTSGRSEDACFADLEMIAAPALSQ